MNKGAALGSGFDDLVGPLREVFEGVAGVHDAVAPVEQLGQVEAIVFGGDENAVEAAHGRLIPLNGGPAGPGGVFTGGKDDRDVGVEVADFSALGLEQVHEFESGRLAHVIHIGFVSEAHEQDAAAFDGFAPLVEGLENAMDDVFRHGFINLSSELDEAGVNAVFAGLPGEVKGVDGNAMATEAGAGVKGGVAKGFGGGGADDFPDIKSHAIGHHFHLIDKTDVDGAIDVFEELGEFGDLGGADRDDFFADTGVKGDAGFQTGWGDTADEFGDVPGGESGVARVFALGGINDVEILADDETTGGDTGDDFFLSGAGIGGAFEANDLAFTEVGEDRLQGLDHVAEVRLMVLGKRGGDANDDGVGLADTGEVAGWLEPPRGHLVGDGGRLNVFDVRFAIAKGSDFGFVHIKAEGVKTLCGEVKNDGKTDVAKAYDADGGAAGFKSGNQRHGGSRRITFDNWRRKGFCGG